MKSEYLAITGKSEEPTLSGGNRESRLRPNFPRLTNATPFDLSFLKDNVLRIVEKEDRSATLRSRTPSDRPN